MDYATLITVFITSIFAPWIAKHGFGLTPDQVSALTAFLIAAPTTVVHWFETKFKQSRPKALPSPTPASTASSSTVAKALPLLFVAALVLGAGSQLTACASLGKAITPASQIVIDGAADVAVATAVQKGIPAAQIKAVATQLLALDNGSAALAAIESAVNTIVAKQHLPPGDVAAVQLLTQSLTAAVNLKLSAPAAAGVTGSTQVAIADVLNAVIQACSFYGV